MIPTEQCPARPLTDEALWNDVRGEPVRFLVLSELFLPTNGGTAVWFDEVYRRMGGKGTHIVTADVPGAKAHDAEHPNTVHRVTLRRYAWLRPESLGMYAKLLAAALQTAIRYPFDAVHAGRVLPEGLIGLIVAWLIRRPLVIYCHGEEVTTWRQRAKLRAMVFTFRHADLIIANSEFTREQLVKLGIPSSAIRLLNPGVDTERFRPELPHADLRGLLGLNGKQQLIVSVGRLSRRKGFDQVIRSLPPLLERGLDVHYALVGIGEDLEYLSELARQTGVAERVRFLGGVAAEDLARWYNAADVVAMPNREINGDTEGFGMVFIEAAACGKPTVAGRAGGTGAAVIDGVTGLRVDGASVDSVMEGLARVLEDPAFARSLGECGYQRARIEFSWLKVAERTLNLHALLVAAARPGHTPPSATKSTKEKKR